MNKNEAKAAMGKQLSANETGKSMAATGGIVDLLEKYKGAISAALPKHLTPERIVRIALTAMNRSPALRNCTPGSIIGAVLESSQLGLELDGWHSALVPYRNNKTGTTIAQFQTMYGGLVSLARRSGELLSIGAAAVREGDSFDYHRGRNSDLKHKECSKPGEITHFYAYADLKGGGFQFDVMTKAQVDLIRARSKASGSGPWVSDYEEMGKKTVLKRMCKLLPRSAELARAVSLDNAAEIGVQDLGIENLNTETGEIESPVEELQDIPAAVSTIINHPTQPEEAK